MEHRDILYTGFRVSTDTRVRHVYNSSTKRNYEARNAFSLWSSCLKISATLKYLPRRHRGQTSTLVPEYIRRFSFLLVPQRQFHPRDTKDGL